MGEGRFRLTSDGEGARVELVRVESVLCPGWQSPLPGRYFDDLRKGIPLPSELVSFFHEILYFV